MLSNKIKTHIIKIARRWSGIEKVILFGSRATRGSSNVSDIDLALVGPAVSDQDVALFHDALENEVQTALKFDVVHLDTLSKVKLRNEIIKTGVLVYENAAHKTTH